METSTSRSGYVAVLIQEKAGKFSVLNRFGRYDLIGKGDSAFYFKKRVDEKRKFHLALLESKNIITMPYTSLDKKTAKAGMNIIQNLYESKGLNRKEAAEFCGVNYTSFSGFFSGSRKPTLEMLNKIGQAFGVSFELGLTVKDSNGFYLNDNLTKF